MKRKLTIVLVIIMTLTFTACSIFKSEWDPRKHSLGEISFDVPEGYNAIPSFDSVVIKKEDESFRIIVEKVTGESWTEVESGQKSIEDARREHYDSIASYWGSEPVEIAGCEGVIRRDYGEDGQLYDDFAIFITDNAVYSVLFLNEVYDDEEEMPQEVFPLTDEEDALFDTFIASITKE